MQNINDERRYVIIGAGMSGILAAIKLLESGKCNIVVYEKGDSVGGTWRENCYPGLTCDVPAHSYVYSFELNPDWSSFVAPGPEIHDYFIGVAKKYGVENITQFGKEIESCIYEDGRWRLKTKCGIQDVADFVIAATGVLHHPRSPDIKGMDLFQGELMHSSRWDESVQLEGKRIAIIGTGSTGVQMTSAIAPIASQLTHFQRTPQWIMPLPDSVYTKEQKERFRNDPEALKSQFYDKDLVAGIERFSKAIVDPKSAAMHEINEEVINHLESSVRDPELQEKLRPSYLAACKRLVYSSEFYAAVQRDNVEVVTEGVTEIEATGIRTSDGVLHEFDVIALATGFHTDKFMRPMKICGRNGATLEELWSDGPVAYLSISMPDFPNFFMLNGPNGPVGNFSLIEISENQWSYIEQLIALVDSGTCREVCVTSRALIDFEKERSEAAMSTVFASGCDSWYLDSSGVPATWPWPRSRFMQEMRAPKLEAYELV